MPQEFGVYPKISALDMLHHLAVMKGMTSSGERKETVDALLQQTNLWDAVSYTHLDVYKRQTKTKRKVARLANVCGNGAKDDRPASGSGALPDAVRSSGCRTGRPSHDPNGRCHKALVADQSRREGV